MGSRSSYDSLKPQPFRCRAWRMLSEGLVIASVLRSLSPPTGARPHCCAMPAIGVPLMARTAVDRRAALHGEVAEHPGNDPRSDAPCPYAEGLLIRNLA